MGSKAEREAAIAAADALVANEGNGPTQTNEGLNTVPNEENNQPVPPKADGTPPKGDSEQLWESKYKVLQGKYNAETKRLNDEIKRINELKASPSNEQELTTLRAEVQDLKQQLATKPPQQEASNMTENEHYKYLVEEFGEELANAVQSMIGNNGSNNEVSQLREQVNNLNQQNAQQVASNNEQSLRTMLSAQGIDFDQVNNDPLFVEWVQQEEGSTGKPKIHFMNQNFNDGDLTRTASYFTAFKAQERSSYDKNNLSQHASVEGSHGNEFEGTEDDVWTSQMIEQLYADKRQGKLSQAEFERYEQDLNKAAAQGRIRS